MPTGNAATPQGEQMANDIEITPDFVNSLLQFTRISERAIGINFDSELVEALQGCLEDVTMVKAAQLSLAQEIKTGIEKLQNQFNELLATAETAQDKNKLLKDASKIQMQIELAVAMLEGLANG